MSFEQATHNEINETVKKAKEDDGRLTEADREKQEIARSVNAIKRMYNPETDQEDAEARNIVLVGINKAAVLNNVNPQDVADLIYGKGTMQVENMLNESFYSATDNIQNGFQHFSGGIDNLKVDVVSGPLDLQQLLFRATPQDVVRANFLTKEENGSKKMFIQIKTLDYRTIDGQQTITENMNYISPREVKSFDEAIQLVKKRIDELREKRKYRVSELDNTLDNSNGRGGQEETPKQGNLNVNPDGRGQGGIDRENLDFSKLLEELGKTKDERRAFEQLDMLGNYTSGASQEVIQQAVINILQNQNLEHQSHNLARIFRRFDNNQEIMKEFWNLPESKLTAFVQEKSRDYTEDNYSYKIILDTYQKLPDKYKVVFLDEYEKNKSSIALPKVREAWTQFKREIQ